MRRLLAPLAAAVALSLSGCVFLAPPPATVAAPVSADPGAPAATPTEPIASASPPPAGASTSPAPTDEARANSVWPEEVEPVTPERLASAEADPTGFRSDGTTYIGALGFVTQVTPSDDPLECFAVVTLAAYPVPLPGGGTMTNFVHDVIVRPVILDDGTTPNDCELINSLQLHHTYDMWLFPWYRHTVKMGGQPQEFAFFQLVASRDA